MKKIKFICLSLAFIFLSCNDNDENKSNEMVRSRATRMFLNTVVGSAGTLDFNSGASTSLGFTLVFPIEVAYSSGAKVTINSVNGLKEAVYNENSALHISTIIFPFSVLMSTNNDELIVSNESDFESLLFSVDSVATVDEFFSSTNCFEFVYPLSVIDNNGGTVTITNTQILQNLLTSMSENDFWIDFIYPFQIEYSGEVVTIENVYDFYSNVDCNPNGWYCTFDFQPTCVETSSSIIQFDNPCWALQAGYSEEDFVTCD
ncbi:MAG TPA: hypothetical protein PLL09_03175 [Flavobacterium sp.]|uniref:hypothetical protein n=1 Tax=unclassified Flavobacterium TaxID=196869 RepID=UPI0025C33E63|nr:MULTISPECIES: hypothetical protein [unclassified Flavobacterium]HRE76806.1 hypothetical protein [Flavobacterium sp.]